jgi:hypothetical protein
VPSLLFSCAVLLSIGFSAGLSAPRTVPAAANPAVTAATVALFATRFTLDDVIDARCPALRPDLALLLADLPARFDDDFPRVRFPNVFSTFFRLVPARLTALFTALLLLPVFFASYRTS